LPRAQDPRTGQGEGQTDRFRALLHNDMRSVIENHFPQQGLELCQCPMCRGVLSGSRESEEQPLAGVPIVEGQTGIVERGHIERPERET
jgi:hypothetical protein